MKFFIETIICLLLTIVLIIFVLCASYSYYKKSHNPVEKIVQEAILHSSGVDINDIIDGETNSQSK